MIIFNSDLDNTIIYSYKHDIGKDAACAEIYQGREISFMTAYSRALLKRISSMLRFVPTTTRTIEQYKRIELGIGEPEYALVCNGGTLLVRGERDEDWRLQSLELIKDSRTELERAEALLKKDRNIILDVRNIDGLFLFTKSEKPEDTIEGLAGVLDTGLVDLFSNGTKVYVVPKELNKGRAVRRLRERLGAEFVIAAGDSKFDIPMLLEADRAFAPAALAEGIRGHSGLIAISEEKLFSDELLKHILEEVDTLI